MAVTFNTREYVVSYGRTPRGRGSWAFFFEPMNADEPFFTPGSTTYSEAKKLARAEAKRRGKSEVFVGT